MCENVEQVCSIAHAPIGSKPTLAPHNWGHLFQVAVNGYKTTALHAASNLQ